MLKLGQLNTLTISRPSENGLYLKDEEDNEVLLPNRFVEEDMQPGNSIEVFLYKDSKDRWTATTQTPKVMLNGYAALEATEVNRIGAFFDWGLDKDLLVPHSQQEGYIQEGDICLVYVYLDQKSERLAGTTKIYHTLERDTVHLNVGDEVELIPYEETEIGLSVVVDNQYQGMLFKNEVFEKVSIGDRLTGYVKKIRSDKKIDVSLNRFGYKKVDDNVKKLLDVLEANGGRISLNDKSAPEDIKNQLGMSKKVFKKAAGALYKERRITITENGIELIKK